MVLYSSISPPQLQNAPAYVPEDDLVDGEGILIDASGGNTHAQNVLVRGKKVGSTDSVQVIQVAVCAHNGEGRGVSGSIDIIIYKRNNNYTVELH